MASTDAVSVRERIMIAAIGLADEVGVARVTMTAVAARAHVSRPTLYSYFSDVSGILDAWVEREVAAVEERLRGVLESGSRSDPLVVLGDYLDLQLTYFAESPTRALLTASSLGSPPQPVARHIERFRHDVHGLLSALGDSGRIRPDVDLELLAGLVIAGITAVTPDVVGGRISPGDARHRLLDILFRGSA